MEILRNSKFSGSDKPKMLFFLYIYEQEKFHGQLSWAWYFFYNLSVRLFNYVSLELIK